MTEQQAKTLCIAGCDKFYELLKENMMALSGQDDIDKWVFSADANTAYNLILQAVENLKSQFCNAVVEIKTNEIGNYQIYAREDGTRL